MVFCIDFELLSAPGVHYNSGELGHNAESTHHCIDRLYLPELHARPLHWSGASLFLFRIGESGDVSGILF